MAKTAVVHKRTVKPGVKRVKRARQAQGAVVRARISAALKIKAEVVLQAIGLDTSTAFRLMMTSDRRRKGAAVRALPAN